MRKGVLNGLRVADFTWIGAGSYTTKILADFGADVIKVESATRMDPLRSAGPFAGGQPGINRSGYFADRNSSKRAMRLNLKHPDGARLAKSLIAASDVVANNFSPGTMESLGLGYDECSRENPGLIYLSMSMQGSSGPHSSYVGYGLTIAALSGLQHLSGLPDRPPVGTGTNYPDHIPNPCHASLAVLAALHHRRKTGNGQFIDFAQTEPMMALLGPAIVEQTVNGRDAGRNGNRSPCAAPRGVYPCRGGRYIAIAAETDAHWLAIAGALQMELATVDRWAQAESRLESPDELDALMAANTASHEAPALMHALQARGVPAGVVNDAQDLVEHDPQLRHRGHWVRLDHAEMGATLYNALPMRLSRTGSTMERPAPLLGEHTVEVCREVLGLAESEIARLQADGALD